MTQNIAASSASSATKSFFGGITGTLGVIVGLIVALILCCGCTLVFSLTRNNTNNSNPSSLSNKQNSQTSQIKAEPINVALSGKGNKDTTSFTLNDGTAKMIVTTTGGTVGTFSSFELKSESNNSLFNGITGSSLTISTNGSEDGKNDTTIRGLSAGKYYVSVISDVNWTINITQ